jgi:hypothetical protein
MKKSLILAAPLIATIVAAPCAYSAGPEKIFGDYQGSIYEDAQTQVNDKFIQANMKGAIKSGKVKETEGSIGGVTIEKGANVFGPIGTNVDTHGADVNILSTTKSR